MIGDVAADRGRGAGPRCCAFAPLSLFAFAMRLQGLARGALPLCVAGCALLPVNLPIPGNRPIPPLKTISNQPLSAALDGWTGGSSDALVATSIAAYVDAHPESAANLARTLLGRLRGGSVRARQGVVSGALRALHKLPPGVERRGLAFDFAIEASHGPGAEASLVDAFGAGIARAAEVEAEHDYSAKLARADASAVASPSDAQRQWYLLASGDPSAVVPLRSLVESFAAKGPPAAAGSLCRSLLRASRYAQSLACADVMGREPNSVPSDFNVRRFVLVTAALSPTLTAEDVLRLFQSRGWDASEVAHISELCRSSGEEALDWESPGGPRDMSTVYFRLAEGSRKAAERRCFLAYSARSCLAELSVEGGCDEPRSLSTYVQALAHEEPSRIDAFLRNKVMTQDLTKPVATIDGGAASSPALLDSGRRALLQVNLALAYDYSEVLPKVSEQPTATNTAQYHVGQARYLWSALHPDAPALPQTLLPPRLR